MTQLATDEWIHVIDERLGTLPAQLVELVLPFRGMVGRPGEYHLADDESTPPVLEYHDWLCADLAIDLGSEVRSAHGRGATAADRAGGTASRARRLAGHPGRARRGDPRLA